MKVIDTSVIEKTIYELALKACVAVTAPCRKALRAAAENEESAPCRFALETSEENFRIALEKEMPVCQDTGVAVVMLEIGQEVYLSGKPLREAVDEGVRKAYDEGRFRKSVCDPLTRQNTGDNTPAALHVEIVKGDEIKVAFMPKGFGSENMSRLYMLTPESGVNGVIDAVIDAVKQAGSRPCPPVIVGVGVGGTFDGCALLAKKALLRDVDKRSDRADVAEIEKRCLEGINALGIGAQGLGGKTTALAVNVEVAPTHIAGLPVAVNIQCHCMRLEKAVIR